VYYPLKPSVQLLNFCSGSGESENPDSDGYEGYEDPNYWPDCNSKYSTLKQLEEAKDGLPENCVDQYIVDVQVEMNDGALKKYKSLIDNGYDKKFEVYEKYLRAQIPEQINHLMATDKVSKYFKCSETKYGTCCKIADGPDVMKAASRAVTARVVRAHMTLIALGWNSRTKD
jgi:hypothetical protein